ncbi:MAG: hypothetical protein OEZ39_04295 [Gammaproteobacteria bacterium]|nr:hypothetical protein [Gammaproteobacteria bacterium]MDH5651079.1 hypothetical protein [Gammaproteobacteria bacterium]
MRLTKLFCLAIALSASSGCAYLHSLGGNLPAQIDEWIAQEEYGKALYTLAYVDKNHADYSQLMRQKAKIQQRVPKLEYRIIEQGKTLLQEKKWHAAQQAYEYGLEKLPDSIVLQKAHTAFIAKRTAYLKQLKLRLLENKADWLLNDKEIREEITAVTPRNYRARWMLQDHNNDIDSTTLTLIECMDESIKDGELDLGRQCLAIARQLTPSTPIQEKLADAEKVLGNEVTERSRHLSAQGEKSLRLAQLALAEGDYNRVKKLLDGLSVHDKKNAQVLAFKKTTDQTLADYIRNRMKEGRRLYSSGEIQQAYLMWKSIQPLAPDNEKLNQLIKRSQHILKKLRHIQNNPENVIIPPGS